MDLREALLEVGKYAPCPHDCVDTNLGDGKTWARCEDCGETVSQGSMTRMRKSFDKFTEALAIVGDYATGTAGITKTMGATMDEEFYVVEEKKLVHVDGWMYYIKDIDDGVIEIGCREQTDSGMTDIGEPLRVSVSHVGTLAKALQYFADRDKNQ
jgi:hypothetical protein